MMSVAGSAGRRKLVLLCLMVVSFFLLAHDATAATRHRRTRRPAARARRASMRIARGPTYASALVVDAGTGQVLYQKDPHQLRAPASLSKMMLELLAFEAVEEGRIRLDEYVRVPDEVKTIRGSRVRLRPGEPVTVGDLLEATAIASANDAATALAIRLAGSADACVAQMNRRARELGMRDTHYENVHGLDRAGEPGNITTAWDLSILARKLIETPEILKLSSTVQTTIRYGQVIHTTNRLLGRCEGVDGLKTGYTARAGFCLVSTAMRENLRVVAVVLGAASNGRRFSESADLLKKIYEDWDLVRVVSKGQDLGQDLKVRDGKTDSVRLIAGEDLDVLVPAKRARDIRLAVAAPPSTRAPITRGWTLGRVQVLVGDSVAAEGPAVASGTIRRAGMPGMLDGIMEALPH